MRAVWMAGRAQLRHRRGATVTLALLVALAGGAVLAAVAGASRTASAMDRFVAYSRPEDVYVSVNGPQTGGGLTGPPSGVTFDQIQAYLTRADADRRGVATLPQVADAGRFPYILMSPDKRGEQVGEVNAFAAADAHAFHTLDRPLVLRGRLPQVDRADEAVVDDITAHLRHVRVGSHITMWSYTSDQDVQFTTGGSGPQAPQGPAYTFRVVGIVRDASTVNSPPVSAITTATYQSSGGVFLTPAFLQAFANHQRVSEESLPGIEGFRIRLRHGLADLAALRRGLAQYDVTQDDLHVGSDIAGAAQKSQRAIHLEAIALVLVAALAGLAALLVAGQALARQVSADAADDRALAALGMDQARLALVPMVRAAVVAVAGAAGAVIVAVALSPLFPIGLARRAEIHPGVSVNVAAVGLGAAVVAAAVMLCALVPSLRAARAGTASRAGTAWPRPSALARLVTAGRMGPAASAGIGMSVERPGGAATRGALAATAVAVAGAVAALTVGGSLHHLVHTPREQGWNWDVVVGNPNNASALTGDPQADVLHGKMVDTLARDRDVGAFSGFATADVTIAGRPVSVAAIEPERGSVWPPILAGRVPQRANELLLGRDPLGQLHRRVGDTVLVSAGPARLRMRIVGVPLQPTAGDLGTRLSAGGVLTTAGLQRLLPQTPVLQFAVRYRAGVNHAAATRGLVRAFGNEVLTPFVGGEVGDLARVGFLPNVLAGVLVALGIGGLGLTLLSSVRRHRRDLGVLKTLGFVRRQAAATAGWQAIVLAAGALVIGVPGGIALGRWTWRLVADSVGSVAAPRIPALAIAAVVPATLAVAAMLAAGPAWAASRVQSAQALRAE